MSQPPRQFFTVTDFDSLSVTTALVQDDILTIAKGDHSLSLPTLIALDIAAETIRLLLDDDDITNGPGLSLSEWLGDDDSEEAAMFDPRAFPPGAGSLLPGPLAATRTGLTPAGGFPSPRLGQAPRPPLLFSCNLRLETDSAGRLDLQLLVATSSAVRLSVLWTRAAPEHPRVEPSKVPSVRNPLMAANHVARRILD